MRGDSDKHATNRRKLVSKWHRTTKVALKQNYRVPSKSEGWHFLNPLHLCYQIMINLEMPLPTRLAKLVWRALMERESVCCNNVRALFDELPTPHLVVEITSFPAGPLTEKDYDKAKKLERVIRSGPCV
ncbi:hypothetical protein ACSBR2_026370 [Camellia fascicularis]